MERSPGKRAFCECLLVVGTGAVVYPAAGLIGLADKVGAAADRDQSGTDRGEPARAGEETRVIGLYGQSGMLLPRLLQLLGIT